MVEGVDYCIDVSADGRTVLVNGADGSCLGRFSKRFGLDVHKTSIEQLAGESQCLHCTHEPAGATAWSEFRAQMQLHYEIDIPANLVSWK